MAWAKGQLSLWYDTSSPVLEPVPSQRVQGKCFPFEKSSGSALPQKRYREMTPGRGSHAGRCFAAHMALVQG